MRAVLLIAHGSRRAEANADLVQVADLVRETGRYDVVEVAYLELAEPSIPAGGRRCVERGATSVVLAPWFLSAGSHVRDDLERFRREFEQSHPGVAFSVAPPLGVHPRMVDVLFDRLAEVEPDGGTPAGAATGEP